MMRVPCLPVVVLGLFTQSTLTVEIGATGGEMSPAQCFESTELGPGKCPESKEPDMTNLLQAGVHSIQGELAAARVHALLERSLHQERHQASLTKQAPPPAPAPALLVVTGGDIIPEVFWADTEKAITKYGMSTPPPLSAKINAPPAKPTPQPWEEVKDEVYQPLDTKLGSAIMFKVTGSVTPTPPPTQARTDQEFIAQCPMVLFNSDLAIRAPSCNNTRGQWIDPSPLNVRPVLRWETLQAGGIRLGVDSAMSGPGAADFATITQEMTLNSYKFVMTNCIGIPRWNIEEMVFRIDNMGQVSSTLEQHDVALNSVAYFFRYIVKNAAGVIAAESTLYRMNTRQVNFTEVINGRSTGKLLAIVTKKGQWEKEGWKECMSPTSPRGWDLHFPEEKKVAINGTNETTSPSHASMATVQDLRVVFAGAITLMSHRDEMRGSDGIDTEGSSGQMTMLAGGIALCIVVLILVVNCCMVFRASGLKDRFKKMMFDSEGALMPKAAVQPRTACFQPTY